MMAYGGVAGAALSKGLLGFLIVAFAWAFYIYKNRDWRAVRKLVHWPIIIVSAILATSWFVYIFSKMPTLAWRQFFGDQITGNMHGHFWSPVFRAPLFALILLLNFLPWSATALEFLSRRKVLEPGNISSPARNFILMWTVVLILGFSLGANVSLRYLLPATPLMAILFADILVRSEKLSLILSTRHILKIILGIVVLLGAAFLFMIWQWSLPVLLPLFGLFALLIFALWRETKRKMISAAAGLGLAILICWPIVFAVAMPVTLPDRSRQIAKALKQSGADSKNPILLVGDLKLVSRLRVTLGENWTVVQANRLKPDAKFYKCVIISEDDIDKFVGRGWTVNPVASSTGKLPPRELLNAIVSRQLPQLLAQHSEMLWLAARE
jgi:4-amino-4-deoxy-L-arabinose transferase-like glycosyltransferase